MKRNVIWAAAAAATTLLLLPVGVVVLEGTTAPATDTADSSSETVVPAGDDATAASPIVAASTSPEPFASQTDAPAFDEPGGFDPNDILKAPIEQLITGETFLLDPLADPVPLAPVRPELSGVSADLPADDAPLVLAELDIDALLGDEFFGGTGSDSVESNAQEGTTKGTAESTVGAGPDAPDAASRTDNPADKDGDKTKKTDGKAPKEEKKENEHDRIEVSLIRPKEDVVNSPNDVIIRTRAKGLKRAFVLVRARQKDAPWWVQDEAERQGGYFRSRAQFGNTKTLDGARFQIVFAFTTEEDDVPEAGEFFDEIPLNYVLSQEFNVRLKR
jgi:hypothetical protein